MKREHARKVHCDWQMVFECLFFCIWVIKAFSSKTASTDQRVAHNRPRQYYENHQAHEATTSTENQTTYFTKLDFQPDFNMAVFSVCAVLSTLKDCFGGLLFEFVPTNHTDKQVHNICIFKMEAGPESVVFSLFSELPHIM